MYNRTSLPYFAKSGFVILLLVKAISNTAAISVVKHDRLKGNSTNDLIPNVKINLTAITDNNIEIPTKESKSPFYSHKSTYIASLLTTHSALSWLLNKSGNFMPTTESLLSPLPLSKNHSSLNFTTIPPTGYQPKTSSHKYYKVLLYVLVPLSAVLLVIGICFLVRHMQKVQRKRRLERELIHQYSYPNSEAGDDDQERLFEVESVINTQFLSVDDQEEKNFDTEIPHVSVAIGEGSKLVIEEESPLINEVEASTSFNC